jgi:hypothetical protein
VKPSSSGCGAGATFTPFTGAGVVESAVSTTGVTDPEGAKLACRFAIDGRPPSSSASAQSMGCTVVLYVNNGQYHLKYTIL